MLVRISVSKRTRTPDFFKAVRNEQKPPHRHAGGHITQQILPPFYGPHAASKLYGASRPADPASGLQCFRFCFHPSQARPRPVPVSVAVRTRGRGGPSRRAPGRPVCVGTRRWAPAPEPVEPGGREQRCPGRRPSTRSEQRCVLGALRRLTDGLDALL